jgi:hypothetical protein
VINIPSAQITFDGRFMEGDFGATLSTVAASLPYEGELRFKLDTQCGYYYFQGAGSFTYFVRFSGQTFIVHAPFGFLTGTGSEPSSLPGVTGILEDLAIRALFAPDQVDEFTGAVGLSDVPPTTVITGVLTTGNVSREFNAGVVTVGAALGPGSFLYQFKDGTQQKYRIGTFARVRARAEVGVLGFGVGVTGDSTLTTNVMELGSLPDLESIFSKGEFDATGSLRLTGCASFLLASCYGSVSFRPSYSTKSGFDLASPNLSGDCGSGGCPT